MKLTGAIARLGLGREVDVVRLAVGMGNGKEKPLRGLLGARASRAVQLLRQPPLLDQELELLDDLRNDGGDAVGVMRLGASPNG